MVFPFNRLGYRQRPFRRGRAGHNWPCPAHLLRIAVSADSYAECDGVDDILQSALQSKWGGRPRPRATPRSRHGLNSPFTGRKTRCILDGSAPSSPSLAILAFFMLMGVDRRTPPYTLKQLSAGTNYASRFEGASGGQSGRCVNCTGSVRRTRRGHVTARRRPSYRQTAAHGRRIAARRCRATACG